MRFASFQTLLFHRPSFCALIHPFVFSTDNIPRNPHPSSVPPRVRSLKICPRCLRLPCVLMEPITEFETALRLNLNSIRLPRSFYQRWGHELQKPVYLLDPNLGYTIPCSMAIDNGDAYLRTNTDEIQILYGIRQGVVIRMGYLGQGLFSCNIPTQGGTSAAPMNCADRGGRDDVASTESLFGGNSDTVSVVEIEGTSTEILFGGDSENSESASVAQYNGTFTESENENEVQTEVQIESADDAPSLLWKTKMTPTLVDGSQTMLIPYVIARNIFSHRPKQVRVMMPDRVLKDWSLIWGDNPQNPFHCSFGYGWLEFLYDYPVIVDAEVSFLKKKSEDIIRIQITYME